MRSSVICRVVCWCVHVSDPLRVGLRSDLQLNLTFPMTVVGNSSWLLGDPETNVTYVTFVTNVTNVTNVTFV